jgi:fused signal recognition particle receptor
MQPKPEIKKEPAPHHEAKKEPEPKPEIRLPRAATSFPPEAETAKPVPVQAKAQEPKPEAIRQHPSMQAPEKKPAPITFQQPAVPAPIGQPKPAHAEPVQPKPEQKKSFFSSITEKLVHPQPEKKPEADKSLSGIERRAESGKREMAPKIGIGTTIKSFFSSEITIGESEVSDLLSDLELSLLEADVAYDVSMQVTEQLRGKLVGMKVPKGEVGQRTKDAIREVLESIMDSDKKFLLPERVRTFEKPVKILFVGPNGAGKTTTMAKVARMLMDSGLTVVFSASDTFRAAAIEQAEVHAARLGVPVIKSKYGADPSSVAFDAINHARSNNIDVVLIDSAGRQDTNTNLLDELKKMDRIAKPNIKIYIGESIGGNSIIDQIRAFDETIGLDGAILTKLDCDAKGGTAISVSRSTGIPVLYLGTGQGYSDLVAFDPAKIAREIMN